MTAAVPDPTVEALVPESAHEWAKDHYVVFCDFSDPDPSKHVAFGTREATWRDAPTTWGEVAEVLAARAAAPDALRVRVEALIERCRGNYADDAGGGEPLRNYVLIEELSALLEDVPS